MVARLRCLIWGHAWVEMWCPEARYGNALMYCMCCHKRKDHR